MKVPGQQSEQNIATSGGIIGGERLGRFDCLPFWLKFIYARLSARKNCVDGAMKINIPGAKTL